MAIVGVSSADIRTKRQWLLCLTPFLLTWQAVMWAFFLAPSDWARLWERGAGVLLLVSGLWAAASLPMTRALLAAGRRNAFGFPLVGDEEREPAELFAGSMIFLCAAVAALVAGVAYLMRHRGQFDAVHLLAAGILAVVGFVAVWADAKLAVAVFTRLRVVPGAFEDALPAPSGGRGDVF